MAFCQLAGEAAIFATTPLDNLFIQEYMLRAPGDYVKVYIYGLMQSIYPSTAEPTIERFSAALGLDIQVVSDAFSYWKRKKLVRESKESPENFVFIDLRASMFDSSSSIMDSKLFEYSELNSQLEVAANGRVFTPRELDTIYDWIEIFHLSHETVVLLVGFCVKKYKKKATIDKMDSLARQWHKNDIKTPEKAREHLLGIDLRNSPASKILTKIGVSYRNVSHDEHILYEKWTDEWGFTLDAILNINMTGIQNPNFKYLDKMLANYHKRGLHTAHAILQSDASQDELRDIVQQFAFQLGVRSVTDEHKRYYLKWRDRYGMNDESILAACKEASAQGNGSFKFAESIISSYSRRGIKTVEAIHIDRKLESDASRVLKAAGVSRPVTQKDKELVASWQKTTPFEVVLQGASYCCEYDRPLAALSKVITAWAAKNITTIAQAKLEHSAHSASYSNKAKLPGATVSKDFEQRTYDEEGLNDLFD